MSGERLFYAHSDERYSSCTGSMTLERSDEEWRQVLTAEQYTVLRQQGTEPPFTGAYWDDHSPGTYHCAGCNTALFAAEDKFDSGTGWPSFTRPVLDEAVGAREDDAFGMRRIEVVCRTCGGHLGHVFPDGPKPSGLRYCINSCSLTREETSA